MNLLAYLSEQLESWRAAELTGGNLDVAVDDYLAHNINYIRHIFKVKLPPFD